MAAGHKDENGPGVNVFYSSQPTDTSAAELVVSDELSFTGDCVCPLSTSFMPRVQDPLS